MVEYLAYNEKVSGSTPLLFKKDSMRIKGLSINFIIHKISANWDLFLFVFILFCIVLISSIYFKKLKRKTLLFLIFITFFIFFVWYFSSLSIVAGLLLWLFGMVFIVCIDLHYYFFYINSVICLIFFTYLNCFPCILIVLPFIIILALIRYFKDIKFEPQREKKYAILIKSIIYIWLSYVVFSSMWEILRILFTAKQLLILLRYYIIFTGFLGFSVYIILFTVTFYKLVYYLFQKNHKLTVVFLFIILLVFLIYLIFFLHLEIPSENIN